MDANVSFAGLFKDEQERQLHELAAKLHRELECVDVDVEEELRRHREEKGVRARPCPFR